MVKLPSLPENALLKYVFTHFTENAGALVSYVKALFEGIQIAALFNMMNRIVEGAGVSFDYDQNSSAHPAVAMGENAKQHKYI